jgi:hypothetical protein
MAGAAIMYSPGLAAAEEAPSPSPSISDSSVTIRDEKLDAAAEAVQRVVSIKHNYERLIEKAALPDRQRLVDQANAELTKAVTDHGLSIDEYAAILLAAKSNPLIREKLVLRIDSDCE